jgi:hypothetical protein
MMLIKWDTLMSGERKKSYCVAGSVGKKIIKITELKIKLNYIYSIAG